MTSCLAGGHFSYCVMTTTSNAGGIKSFSYAWYEASSFDIIEAGLAKSRKELRLADLSTSLQARPAYCSKGQCKHPNGVGGYDKKKFIAFK